MVKAKRDSLKYENADGEEYVNFHDDEGFVDRESGYVQVPIPIKPRGKGKRSLEDMMARLAGSVPEQSAYALHRIASIEDQLVKVLALCTPEARELVLKQRPSLRRYWSEE
jgi:hypothetical protein